MKRRVLRPVDRLERSEDQEIWESPSVRQWTRALLDSYRHWTAKELIEPGLTELELSRRLFCSPFVVVSHGLGEDPLFNYANRVALNLWEMSWEEFCRTPSRLTTEPDNQKERAEMLKRAAGQGVIEDYRGIRITKGGRRFLVEQAVVWNVVDVQGAPLGQAATFSRWIFLDHPD